jgi:Tfp pilus assembly protein PilF
VVIATTCALLATWVIFAERQVGVWRNSDTLFTHALEVTDRNALVHNNYGVVLYEAGEFDRSAQQFRAAIAIDRSIPDYHDNLGFLWANLGDMHGAVSEFRRALAISPTNFSANYHMGEALLHLENFEGAIQHLQRAQALNPNHPEVRRLLNQAQTLRRNRR